MFKLHYVCYFMANDLSCLRTMKSNPPLGDHADAHTFETMDIRSWRHLENLECDHLVFIPTLPNIDDLGDALRVDSLPHDALEFI